MSAESDEGSESFAFYLARHYVAKQGFRPILVPGSEALKAYADLVLFRSDGLTAQMIVMIDRQTHPDKIFAMPAEELSQIAATCHEKYCGQVSRQKMPFFLQIFEIGKTPITQEQIERLTALAQAASRPKINVTTWALDQERVEIWSSASFLRIWREKRFIFPLLEKPRISREEIASSIPKSRAHAVRPHLTLFILGVLLAVFIAEQLFPITPAHGFLEPSLKTLLGLGALNKLLIQHHEWWRLFSATLLHGGLLHLIFNSIALYFAGLLLENSVGRAWTGALFIVGALGGSLMSLTLNSAQSVSVGASGAITCLLAAAYIVSFRYPFGRARNHAQTNLLQILIPSLIPLLPSLNGHKVDFGAHLGGALAGLIMGFLLLKCWKPQNIMPPLRSVATSVCILGVVGYGLSLLIVVHRYQFMAALLSAQH